jgi:CheY-like chemotaxis protein
MCLIAVTGSGQRPERARTDAAGFDTHLARPVDLPSLTALLDKLEPVSGDGAWQAGARPRAVRQATSHRPRRA